MTAHELARALLEMPDESVYFWEYAGGNDELSEVKDVQKDSDGYLVLYTYKQ
jgi:hypothetical protein